MAIGIFGGTFDPPHIGHLILADEALTQLGLDRVLWVLTADPPHKQSRSLTDLDDRLDMLTAAIASNPCFEISRVDIDRPPPHYAVDTVGLLSQIYLRDTLVYLMGGDSLHDLPSWHTPVQFVEACSRIGVLRRPRDRIDMRRLERLIPGVTGKIQFIDAPRLDISSTEIRHKISEGRPYQYYLPPAVYLIIQAKNIYSHKR
jgi:nicotinate-nucleotide adenylyltransferase